MKKFVKIVIAAMSTLPMFALAVDASAIVDSLKTALTNVPALIIAVALIYFLTGVYKYASGGDEKTRGDAKFMIVYGLVALFVMTAVWGLVGVIGETVGITGGGTAPAAPGI